MRVPFEWLRELTGIEASVDDVATRLTNAGFEVGAIHRAGEHWDRVVVGEVARIDPHPNADRLNLPTVNTGSEEIQVVCGAWNFEARRPDRLCSHRRHALGPLRRRAGVEGAEADADPGRGFARNAVLD